MKFQQMSIRQCAGFAFDRQWVVVREADGKFITQRQVAWKLADAVINHCTVHLSNCTAVGR